MNPFVIPYKLVDIKDYKNLSYIRCQRNYTITYVRDIYK